MTKDQHNLSPRNTNSRKCRDTATVFKLETIEADFKVVLDTIDKNLLEAQEFEKNGKLSFACDLYRYQIAFLCSGFDYFIHCLYKNKAEKMFDGSAPRTDLFLNTGINMSDVLDAIDNRSINNPTWLINFINERIATETFLDVAKFKKGLNFMSKELFCELASNVFSGDRSSQIDKLTTKLDNLFKRRHAIVHQNDRLHSSGQQQAIDLNYVIDQKDFIEKVASTLIKLVS